MNHLGEFEGIGGFALAARLMGWKTKGWCEIDPFCQLSLRKNFPEAHGFGDIKKLTYATYKSVLRNRGDRDRRIDIITGGFPCQPYSVAGNRNGNDDDRALWPEMFRTVQEFKPAIVVGENVAGILSMDGGRVFDGILTDLENAGYSVETYIVPAVGVGAPHKRDRVWIVATNAKSPERKQPRHSRGRRNGPSNKNQLACANPDSERQQQQARLVKEEWQRTCDGDNTMPHPNGKRCQKYRIAQQPVREGFCARCNNAGGTALNAQCRAWQNDGHGPESTSDNKANELCHPNCGQPWEEHWLSVATRVCRVDDGIPAGMDGTGLLPARAPTKQKAGKAKRIKALGNAIVPQIAFEIFKAIESAIKLY